MFKARTPPSILHSPPTNHHHHHPSSLPLASLCVRGFPQSCTSPCMCSMKGARAAEVQSLVHVLKCSPRDGPYYPCLLHQQGPGARAGSWPFVSKQMEMGRGERSGESEEEEWGGGIEWTKDGEGEGRKSQSVLIKCCIEDDVPPQCVSSRGWSPSHSDSRSDHLHRRPVRRCARMH